MLLFVYGTLRKGFGNNGYLKNSRFLGIATTVNKYAMFGQGIPFVNKNIPEYPIVGEVYDVEDKDLGPIDNLEGHPHWYKREPIDVVLHDNKEVIKASIYFNDSTNHLMPTGDYTENRKRNYV